MNCNNNNNNNNGQQHNLISVQATHVSKFQTLKHRFNRHQLSQINSRDEILLKTAEVDDRCSKLAVYRRR